MEPNNIDLTFIDIIRKNLIQQGCRSGITSDRSNRYDMSYYKMLLIRRYKPPKAEYKMKTNARGTRVKSKPPWLKVRPSE
jgi:hypothetical protein